jgi:hypothetical protein
MKKLLLLLLILAGISFAQTPVRVILKDASNHDTILSTTMLGGGTAVDSPLAVDVLSMPPIPLSGTVTVDSPLTVDVRTMPAATLSDTVFVDTCTAANTIYSQVLPSNTVDYEIFCSSTTAVLKIGWQNNSGYLIPLPAGSNYYSQTRAGCIEGAKTIYFSSDTAGIVIYIHCRLK